MSHPHRQPNNNECYPPQLRAAIAKFLPARGLGLIAADGRRRWSDRLLVIAAILLAWAPGRSLGDAFGWARGQLVRMYPTRRRPGRGWAGFWSALERAHDDLLAGVVGTCFLLYRRLKRARWL